MYKSLVVPALIVLTQLTTACTSVRGPFTWVDAYNGAPQQREQLINAGDLISVSVREDDKIAARSRVREDNKIAVPLLDDVDVGNQTAAQVARRIEERLKTAGLVTNPHVTVVVEEARVASVSVVGAVSRPGIYPLVPGSGVLEALASAGSLTEFAHKDRIFVLRRTPQPVRIRFTYQNLTSGSGPAAAFRLQSGDAIIVE